MTDSQAPPPPNPPPKKQPHSSGLHNFAAGAASGFISSVTLQPLDVVKTRVQLAPSSQRGLLAAFRHVLTNDGIGGLWKGTVPTLIRTVPGVGIYFYSLQVSKQLWSPTAGAARANAGSSGGSALSPWRAFGAGVTARGVAAVLTLPLTVIKTRFESGVYNYSGVANALSTIYKTESLKGLFRGTVATLLRDAPFSGIYYTCYEQIRHLASGPSKTPTPLVNLSSGMIAGFLATCATQPPDVIRARMQLNPARYTGTLQSLRLILSEEGVSGLTRGMAPRVLRKSITTGVTWAIYEEAVLYLSHLFGKE